MTILEVTILFLFGFLCFIAGMLFESRKLSDAELRAAQHELDEFEEKL